MIGLGVVVAATLLSGCSRTPHQQAVPTGRFASDLDSTAAAAVAATETDMSCVAVSFGREPTSATRLTDVTTIYAWVRCQANGTSDAPASEIMPVVVHLPSSVRALPDDAGTAAVDSMFPADVRSFATRDPSTVTFPALPTGTKIPSPHVS
jgi:hypothetical protein